MVDYKLDGGFDIIKSDYGSFQEVDGLEEFEQDLVVDIHYELIEILASGEKDTLKDKITLMATRQARERNLLDSVHQITVSETDTADTVDVEISYKSGRIFEETI